MLLFLFSTSEVSAFLCNELERISVPNSSRSCLRAVDLDAENDGEKEDWPVRFMTQGFLGFRV